MCAYVHTLCVGGEVPQRSSEDIGSSGTGVIGECELPNRGAGSHLQGLEE